MPKSGSIPRWPNLSIVLGDSDRRIKYVDEKMSD